MATAREARGGTLVIGGGYVARLLGRRGATVVGPENFVLFTPLLPEAASDTLEPRHVVVPLRAIRPRAELLLGRATAVDWEARRAQVEGAAGRYEVRFEGAVVALGSDATGGSRTSSASACAAFPAGSSRARTTSTSSRS